MTACLLAVSACSVSKSRSMQFANNPVVAHRGAFKANQFPENSIASLKEAIRLGCTGTEFDVRMTADDSLVVNHDPHYAGKEIEKASFAELRATPLSNGELLPTLRDYLRTGMQGNRQTRLVLEIKPSATKERGQVIAERVVQLVNELKAAPWIVYISFDYDMLKKVVSLVPGVQTQYLTGDKPMEQLKADGITGADYHISVFQKNPGWVDAAREQGIVLNAWTVNEEKEMVWLLDRNFPFITTNEPELLLRVWKQRTNK
jgi:glycerophosphoryl diester phosphodiesterase